METVRRTRPGRPRHIPERGDGASPRDQILGAAARLFVSNGFAGTSTREIADLVGIRQASLYYHFAGKDDIVAELLEKTVRPTLDGLDELAQIEGTETRLYTLAFRDAQVLAEVMYNIGLLPSLPDVIRAEVGTEYEEARQELRHAYGVLGLSCATEAVTSTIGKSQLGGLILQNVESVIRTRVEGDTVDEDALRAVAASCLRICGVPEERVQAAADAAPLS